MEDFRLVLTGVYHLQPEPLLLQSTKGISGVQGRTLPLPARTSAELLCSPTPGMERRIERGKQRPVTGPALPPHRPGSHNGNGSPGFHFESPGRPSRPGQRPNDHRGNGFRLDPVQKPGNQGTKPDNDNKRPSVARPQSNNSNREYPVTNPQPRSHYNRRSSTRTTVNRSSVRPESSTVKPQRSPRVQSTQRIQRNSTRPSFSKPTPSVKRSPAAPRSKREPKR